MRGLAALTAIMGLVAGCGSDGGGGTSWSITSDLAAEVHTYQAGTATWGFLYNEELELVLGLLIPATGNNPLGLFGDPTGARSFDIVGAGIDDDEDFDVLEEPALPLASDAAGVFSADGSTIDLDLAVRIAGIEVSFSNTGNLIGTSPTSREVAESFRSALTH